MVNDLAALIVKFSTTMSLPMVAEPSITAEDVVVGTPKVQFKALDQAPTPVK
jgi:hypothetical protein